MSSLAALHTNDHLTHRIGILEGFLKHRAAFGGQVYTAMHDGTLVTCRALWELLGIVTESWNEPNPATPTNTKVSLAKRHWPTGIGISNVERFKTTDEFLQLDPKSDILVTLVAANKCVAHLDNRPHHGAEGDRVARGIDTLLRELEARATVV